MFVTEYWTLRKLHQISYVFPAGIEQCFKTSPKCWRITRERLENKSRIWYEKPTLRLILTRKMPVNWNNLFDRGIGLYHIKKEKSPCTCQNIKLCLFGFGFGILESASGPNFPSAWATMLALHLDCSTAALTTPQKVLFNYKLVELRMLDFNSHTRLSSPWNQSIWCHRTQILAYFCSI